VPITVNESREAGVAVEGEAARRDWIAVGVVHRERVVKCVGQPLIVREVTPCQMSMRALPASRISRLAAILYKVIAPPGAS